MPSGWVRLAADDGTGKIVPLGDPGALPGSAAQAGLPVLESDLVTAAQTVNAGNANLTSGTATAGSVATVATTGKSTAVFSVSANTLNVALSLYGSVDGANWVALTNPCLLNQATAAFQSIVPAAATGVFTVAVGDFEFIRLSTPTGALTGTATIVAASSAAPALVTPDAAPVVVSATAIGGTSGNVANATATATLAAVAGKLNYLSNIEISLAGATAAAVVVATITGLKTGTRSIVIDVPAGVTASAQPLALLFDPPIPASAVNTAIVVTLPALGAGNTNAAVNASGWQQ